MIGKKFVLLQNGEIIDKGEALLKTPFLEEWKHSTIKNTKKYSYIATVNTIRFYLRAVNFTKNKYQELKIKLGNMRRKNSNRELLEKREENKFLKMIGEYKQKIREIKHKIKEEEEL